MQFWLSTPNHATSVSSSFSRPENEGCPYRYKLSFILHSLLVTCDFGLLQKYSYTNLNDKWNTVECVPCSPHCCKNKSISRLDVVDVHFLLYYLMFFWWYLLVILGIVSSVLCWVVCWNEVSSFSDIFCVEWNGII